MQLFKSRWLSYFLTAGFIGLLVWYFINNQESLEQLLTISPLIIGVLALLKISRLLLNGLFTKFVLKVFDKDLSYQEANYLSLYSAFGNFFGPILGGASIRAVYLKKKYNLEYSRFISTLYGYYLVSFMIISIIALSFLGLDYVQDSTKPGLVLVILLFMAVFISTLVLLLIPPSNLDKLTKSIRVPSRLRNMVSIATEGWTMIRASRSLLMKLSMLNLVLFILASLESWILYTVFAEDFTINNVVIYTALGALSLLISFTPGAIGFREAIFLASTSLIALDTTQILQIAAVDRSVTFLLLSLLFFSTRFLPSARLFKSH